MGEVGHPLGRARHLGIELDRAEHEPLGLDGYGGKSSSSLVFGNITIGPQRKSLNEVSGIGQLRQESNTVDQRERVNH